MREGRILGELVSRERRIARPDSTERLWAGRVRDTGQSEESEALLSIVARDTLGVFSGHEAMAKTNDTETLGSEEVVADFGGERGGLGRLSLGVGKVSEGRIQDTLSLHESW
jgi:hypothetical protein